MKDGQRGIGLIGRLLYLSLDKLSSYICHARWYQLAIGFSYVVTSLH